MPTPFLSSNLRASEKMFLAFLVFTVGIVVQASVEFAHPTMCLIFQRRPVHSNFGMIFLPIVRKLPTSCHVSECKKQPDGADYQGKLSVTKSGRECQNWSYNKPHASTLSPSQKSKVWNQANYCRNPNGYPGGPWCYTTDPDKRWEACSVPMCSFETTKRFQSLTQSSVSFQRSQSSKKKRGVPFVSALSILLTGIKTAMGISNHNELKKLHSTVDYLEKNQQAIKKSLAKSKELLTTLETNVHDNFLAMKHLEDYSTTMDRHILCQLDQIKTENFLDAISNQKLTTALLPPETVHDYLIDEPKLRDTIYTQHPSMLYELGEVHLLGADPELGLSIFLIMIPDINAAPNGFLYTPLSVPRFELQDGDSGVLLESFLPLTPPPTAPDCGMRQYIKSGTFGNNLLFTEATD